MTKPKEHPLPTANNQFHRNIRPLRMVGALAFVPLADGREATIDAADAGLVAGYNWYATRPSGAGPTYARTTVRQADGRLKGATMHRLILGLPPSDIDHADGDGLNNRRGNLRLCTDAENQANRRCQLRNKLGVKGVIVVRGKFRASIGINGRTRSLGTYQTIEEARAAYQAAARLVHREFARFQ